MNQHKQVKSSSIFLIELICAIFFFSLASAVCVQIFVKAHIMSQSSQKKNFAISECSSIAEILTTADSMTHIKERLDALYPASDQSAFPSVTLYYDENFEPCTVSSGAYRLTFIIQDISQTISKDAEAFRTIEALITFKETDSLEQIYTQDIVHHFAQEVRP